MPNERSVRREMRAPRYSLGGGGAEEVERQVDRGATPRDVVLQVGVEPLVPQVDIDGECNDDNVEIERRQLMLVGQSSETRIGSLRLVLTPFDVSTAEGRRSGLPLEERPEVRLADVQSPKAIVRNVLTVRGWHACRRSLQQAVEPPQRGKEPGERLWRCRCFGEVELCRHRVRAFENTA